MTDASEAALERAIHDHCVAEDLLPDGHFLARWLVVGYSKHPEQPKLTSYFITFPDGTMPSHEVKGLAVMAADLADEAEGDEED